ncbi:MAG: hypothetical protein IT181_01915 [Acidobacteria bacterium]|nr:hypothetical protein [Acidobacteriota bacterium]
MARSSPITAVASLVLAAVLGSGGPVRVATPVYYPDDPIAADDDTALDASKVAEVEDANSYDFLINTVASPGERRDVRALNVNTVDQVPDSSWFRNRASRGATIADLVRGPDRLAGIILDGWAVSSGKGTGVQPGFRMTDPSGQLYQIEFDPPSNPEMATGAEIIGTAFYHAFGYHVVEVYLGELDPAQLLISNKATVFDPRINRRRAMSRRDVDGVLRRSARLPNGRYRVLASRFASGKPLGNFRYYGTRTDDPNDIVPHEHRRELRGARVFGAWLNHDDSRGVNSLDMLETAGGRSHVRHYMFDFGSMLGSGTIYAQRHRPGNEYIFEMKPGLATLATLGLYTRPWMHIDYPADTPRAVGRFEATAFEPGTWKPEYPNPAFDNLRGDDAFWGAQIVATFDAAAIRAIVDKARFTDPKATEYMTKVLVARQEKVLQRWLTAVNPVVDVALSDTGTLTFANAAERAGMATPVRAYVVRWARFDNATGASSPVGPAAESPATTAMAPPALLDGARDGDIVEVTIVARHAEYPAWATPVTAHFRSAAGRWTLVGLNRLP